MIKNYFLVALRNFKNYKFFSFINITGLAIGMACSFLIFIWVKDEFSFDQFHKNETDIFRLVGEVENADALFKAVVTPYPMVSYLNDEIPEIINHVCLRPMSEKVLVEYESEGSKGQVKKFYEGEIIAVDSNFFEFYTYEFIKGNPEKAIIGKNSVVISESTARKYFGNEDPIGKTLFFFNRDWFGTVSGVLKDPPSNSHMQFDIVIPFGDLFGSNFKTNWGNYYYNGYVQLAHGTDPQIVVNKIEEALKRRSPDSEISIRIYLQALSDVHLKSDFDIDYNNSTSEINNNVYIFSIIAVFILLIACLNFVNLTTARSGTRAKEIGLRKISGASRARLIRQFFGESIFIAIIAYILAIIIILLFLNAFNQLTDKSLNLRQILNVQTILIFFGIAIFVGLVSGIYPALLLSSFEPLRVLKGEIKSESRNSGFRKILVLVQFSISIILIISVFIVQRQLEYVRKKELGYDKKSLIYLPVRGNYRNYYSSLRERLLQESNVQNVTISSDIPLNTIHLWGGLDWAGKDPDDNTMMNFYTVDYGFIPTLGIQLSKGRNFTLYSDSNNYIINETAARIMGMDEPLDQWFSLSETRGNIIGIVKDFNFKSLRTKVEPLVIRVSEYYNYILVRINDENVQSSIDRISAIWSELNPDYPFEYHFLDNDYEQLYLPEKRFGILFKYFTILAIFISCLGLLGLVSFMAQQRTKEIGLRKVLGSSVIGIIRLLSMEFTKWVILANIIAIPIGWYSMNKWLQNFAFRTNIPWLIFVLTAVLVLLIALITISFQSYQAATANPADSIRQD
ncbi:MAG: ABC transporter permease [Bacteroidales bacterium]|nr:ABC transporter permease [Bacteroidales bacterium]